MRRPEPSEIASYFHGYIALVPDGDLLATMRRQRDETAALLAKLSPKEAAHRYQPGKWSVAEVFGHLADSERVMVYRALRFARGDQTPLPGFDENSWVASANFARRPLAAIAAELRSVRDATLTFFAGLDEAAAARSGTANQNPMSVRGLAWVVAGHELHHLKVLRERYGIAG
jgi:uncharacterized damage-inducible protein DinB